MIQAQNNKAKLHYNFRVVRWGDVHCSLDSTHVNSQDIELMMSYTYGNQVTVQSITITFPLGSDQATKMAPGNVIAFTYSPTSEFLVTQPSPGVFKVTAPGGKSMNWQNQGLYIRFQGIPINTTPGVFRVDVKETYSGSQSQAAYYWFGKFPYAFYMANLVADKTSVNAGDTVTLKWEGAANASYLMSWSDAQGGQSADVTNVRSWVSPPLGQDTVFLLTGRSTDGTQATEQLQTMVAVSNPVLSASSLSVSGGPVLLNAQQPDYAVNNMGGGQAIVPMKGNAAVQQNFPIPRDGNIKFIEVFCMSVTQFPEIRFTLGTASGANMAPITGATGTVKAYPNQWCTLVFDTPIPVKAVNMLALSLVVYEGQLNLAANAGAVPPWYTVNVPQGMCLWLRVGYDDYPTGGVLVTPDGKMGVNTLTPQYLMDVNGTLRASQVIEGSDMRLKQNIRPMEAALPRLLGLQGVRYEREGATQTEIGLLAQELAAVYPELVRHDGDGMAAVAYNRLTVVLLEAVKELNRELRAVKEELARLKGGMGEA